MKKTAICLFSAALVFAVASPLHAQGTIHGCVDSPENPTAILAMVGSAGAFLVSARARLRARRSK